MTHNWLFILETEHVLEIIELFDALIFECHFAANELEAEFNLVAFVQKALSLLKLNLEIVRIGVVTDPNFFDVLGLFRTILTLFALFFVFVLPVIENFGDWRFGQGRYNNEIELESFCFCLGSCSIYFTYRSTSFVNQKYARCTNPLIDWEVDGYRELLLSRIR